MSRVALTSARVPRITSVPVEEVAEALPSVTVAEPTAVTDIVPLPALAKVSVTSKRSLKFVTSLRSSSSMARPARETVAVPSEPVK